MPEEVEPTETGEVVAPVETPVAPEADPFDSPDTTTFDRGYVERLRTEAAEHRTKAKTYEDVFTGYGDDERQIVLDLARNLKANPAAAFKQMEEAVTEYNKRLAEAGATHVETPVAAGGDTPLTMADLDRILGEKEAAKAQAAAIDDVYAQVNKLGVDPESKEGILVMHVALNETGGDIAAAYKVAIEEPKQRIIDEYVAAKAAESNSPGAATAGTGGTPAGGREIKSLADSKIAARERLEALRATQT